MKSLLRVVGIEWHVLITVRHTSTGPYRPMRMMMSNMSTSRYCLIILLHFSLPLVDLTRLSCTILMPPEGDRGARNISSNPNLVSMRFMIVYCCWYVPSYILISRYFQTAHSASILLNWKTASTKCKPSTLQIQSFTAHQAAFSENVKAKTLVPMLFRIGWDCYVCFGVLLTSSANDYETALKMRRTGSERAFAVSFSSHGSTSCW